MMMIINKFVEGRSAVASEAQRRIRWRMMLMTRHTKAPIAAKPAIVRRCLWRIQLSRYMRWCNKLTSWDISFTVTLREQVPVYAAHQTREARHACRPDCQGPCRSPSLSLLPCTFMISADVYVTDCRRTWRQYSAPANCDVVGPAARRVAGVRSTGPRRRVTPSGGPVVV